MCFSSIYLYMAVQYVIVLHEKKTYNMTHLMEERFLTGVFLQKLLELAPLKLNRLLHQMRSDASQGKVSHVHLHQVQHREYSPRQRMTVEDRDINDMS